MEKNKLLKQMGFSDEYIGKLDEHLEQTVYIHPNSFSEGVIQHESTDTSELVLHHGNEGADNGFIVSL